MGLELREVTGMGDSNLYILNMPVKLNENMQNKDNEVENIKK